MKTYVYLRKEWPQGLGEKVQWCNLESYYNVTKV